MSHFAQRDDTYPFPFHDPQRWCPCTAPYRNLEEDEPSTDPIKIWEVLYMSAVLIFMFGALISDKIGADMVMLTSLALCMVSRIISTEEGLEGFANEGILTVMVLFVVAAGIHHTGALDWYMGKLLGRPNSIVSAQLRLMIPIGVVSALMNNTPVVVVMIPIVQRWGKNLGVSPKKLLIPLSFASILGGTCTLIGTSTNLVVAGLLATRYPELPPVGLWDIGLYGVPIALAGMTYILLASPCLLDAGGDDGEEDVFQLGSEILLKARLTRWSTAAGRSVKRSGLRDTGGIYLVSVERVKTGNVHRAVGQDFVLNVGDVLYFTGLVESFGMFCAEHDLEVITNEVEMGEEDDEESLCVALNGKPSFSPDGFKGENGDNVAENTERSSAVENISSTINNTAPTNINMIPPQSLPPSKKLSRQRSFSSQDQENEKIRQLNRMRDLIRGFQPSQHQQSNLQDDEITQQPSPFDDTKKQTRKRVTFSESLSSVTPAKIVIQSSSEDRSLISVGIDAPDRPGLLLDISKTLLTFNLQLHHTEASVIRERSLSVWKCQFPQNKGETSLDRIAEALGGLLKNTSGSLALKQRGLQVIRAVVPECSGLVGRTPASIVPSFRDRYGAAIVAIQKKNGDTPRQKFLSEVVLERGDVLVLQAEEGSIVLVHPPKGFYESLCGGGGEVGKAQKGKLTPTNSVKSLVNMVMHRTFSKERMSVSSKEKEGGGIGERQGGTGEGVELAQGDVEGYDLYLDLEVNGHVDNTAKVEDDLSSMEDEEKKEPVDREMQKARERVWKDLRVLFSASTIHPNPTSSTASGAAPAEESATPQEPHREFLIAMEIAHKSQLANKTALQSNLTKLPDVFLVSIERPIANAQSLMINIDAHSDNQSFHSLAQSQTDPDETFANVKQAMQSVNVDEVLNAGDILWFAGAPNSISDLRKIPGLKYWEAGQITKLPTTVHERRLVQAVVAKTGPLVGSTVREAEFRTRFGAAVIAIQRSGKRVYEHPGAVKLQSGDVLLLEAGPNFMESNADSDRYFALLAEVKDSAPPRIEKLIPALVLTAAMLVAYMVKWASLLVSAMLASILMVAFGIISQQEARNAVQWDIYTTIASAFGIGNALVNSGIATGISNGMVSLAMMLGWGDAGLYAMVYLSAFLISSVVTNNAAAALLFPIAMDVSEQQGVDVTTMGYCLMLGASASFMSPFGYTTNLLIYGPGGYKYNDFVKFGTPMQIVLWILTVALLSQNYETGVLPWYFSWIVTSVVLLAVAAALIGVGTKGKKSDVDDDNLTPGLESKGV